jgi:dienelactone hydrolase
MRTALAAFHAGLLLLAILTEALAAPAGPGPQGPEEGDSRRQLWLIPIPGERLLMRAIVLRPPGEGPFPLVVINHGSVESADVRAKFFMPNYPIIQKWFLDRNYVVVLPQRPGHGETGGPYFEDQGFCEEADFQQSGLRTADSIEATIGYMTTQPFVRRRDVIVVGQSAGGWGAIALASRNPSGVKAMINFSGGRGGRAENIPNNNCSPDRLVAAAAAFGASARTPTLWFYSENDDYFGPALSGRMYQAFRSAGGNVEFHLLPPFAEHAHLLINSEAAFSLWAPLLEKFLAAQR